MDARHWLGIGSIALGAGVAAASLLGPLVGGVIEYHVPEDVLNQVMGADAAALALVAPVAIVAGILALRGHPAAPVLALGPAVFAAYTYAQLALGGEFLRHPGNSEDFFPLLLALFVLGGAIAVGSWASIDPLRLPATPRRLERGLGWMLIVVAAFLVVGLHLPGLLAVWGGEPTEEYLASPATFWIVKLMDLGIVVPVAIVTGIGMLRRAVWVRKATYAMIGWVALLGSSVAGMAIVMQANDDPTASTANSIVFGVFAVIFLALAVRLYRPLFGRAVVDVRADRERAHAGSG